MYINGRNCKCSVRRPQDDRKKYGQWKRVVACWSGFFWPWCICCWAKATQHLSTPLWSVPQLLNCDNFLFTGLEILLSLPSEAFSVSVIIGDIIYAPIFLHLQLSFLSEGFQLLDALLCYTYFCWEHSEIWSATIFLGIYTPLNMNFNIFYFVNLY